MADFASHPNGKHFPITPKKATIVNMDSVRASKAAFHRTITRQERARLATLENPLLYSNFIKKLEKLNGDDFDPEWIDKKLEPDEALMDLKRKHPHVHIGLKAADESAEFRHFLEDDYGITNKKLQNMIEMEDNPLNEEELAQLSYILASRSEHAQAIDKAQKAPIAKDVREWMKDPARTDIKTLDQ